MKGVREGLMLAVALLGGPLAGHGQELRYTWMAQDDASRVRLDLFYGLPKDATALTFVELYNQSWYSKSFFTRPIRWGVGPRLETVNTSWYKDQVGVGLQKDLDVGEGNYANLGITPWWVDVDGHHLDDKALLSAAWGITLGRFAMPVRLEGFLDYNYAAGDLDYGEAYLLLDMGGGVLAGLGVDFLADSDPRAGIQVRYVMD